MSNEQIAVMIFTILISIIGFFLRALYSDIKRVEGEQIRLKNDTDKQYYENKTRIEVIDTNNKNLTEKFDQLFDAVKDLTSEIKHLSLNLERNKNNNNTKRND